MNFGMHQIVGALTFENLFPNVRAGTGAVKMNYLGMRGEVFGIAICAKSGHVIISVSLKDREIEFFPNFTSSHPFALDEGFSFVAAIGKVGADHVPDFPEILVFFLQLPGSGKLREFEIGQIDSHFRNAAKGQVGHDSAMNGQYVVGCLFIGPGSARDNYDFIENFYQLFDHSPVVISRRIETASKNSDSLLSH